MPGLQQKEGPPAEYRKIAELTAGENLLPALTQEERSALKESIEADRRVTVPIVVDENGCVIDGFHRFEIAQEVGIDEVPVILRTTLDANEKKTLQLKLNMARRHLDQEGKRTLIEKAILAGPEKSDRQIAAIVGVHNETVKPVRERLINEGVVTDSVTRTDTKGRKQPASKQNGKTTKPAGKTTPAEKTRRLELDVPETLYTQMLYAADAKNGDDEGLIKLQRWAVGQLTAIVNSTGDSGSVDTAVAA